MGEPYTLEAGACSYTHIRLENLPYEARYKSLLALLCRDTKFEIMSSYIYIYIYIYLKLHSQTET